MKKMATFENTVEVETKAVAKVNEINRRYVKKKDFFMLRKLNIKPEKAITKSNRTCAKKRHKPRHLRRQYHNFS